MAGGLFFHRPPLRPVWEDAAGKELVALASTIGAGLSTGKTGSTTIGVTAGTRGDSAATVGTAEAATVPDATMPGSGEMGSDVKAGAEAPSTGAVGATLAVADPSTAPVAPELPPEAFELPEPMGRGPGSS